MTISEQFFDEYLIDRELTFEVEKGVTAHPDRLISMHNGKKIVCEIRQLEQSKYELANSGGSMDPCTRVRKAIKRKVRQGKEANQNKLPYVVVLFNNGSVQPMSKFFIESAMYGDSALVYDIPRDSKQKGQLRGSFFSANGILRHARSHKESGQPFNRRISAIAVLDTINPTQKILSQEYKKASQGIAPNDIKRLFQIFEDVTAKLKKENKYDESLCIKKLQVFHNLYANNKLDFDIFTGEYDQQYYIDSITGKSKQLII